MRLCPISKKQSFDSEKSARSCANHSAGKRERNVVKLRVYLCNCGYYHLTSQERWEDEIGRPAHRPRKDDVIEQIQGWKTGEV